MPAKRSTPAQPKGKASGKDPLRLNTHECNDQGWTITGNGTIETVGSDTQPFNVGNLGAPYGFTLETVMGHGVNDPHTHHAYAHSIYL